MYRPRSPVAQETISFTLEDGKGVQGRCRDNGASANGNVR